MSNSIKILYVLILIYILSAPVLDAVFSITDLYNGFLSFGSIKTIFLAGLLFLVSRKKKWAYWTLVTFLNLFLAGTLFLAFAVPMAGHVSIGYWISQILISVLLITTIVMLYKKTIRDYHNI